ncbi:MAG TPA: hypothetical protein VIK64_15060 [Anaerolineales bacterium]
MLAVGAEAHMGRRHPHEHRAGFDLLAIDIMVASGKTQCPRHRNPQAMHRIASLAPNQSRSVRSLQD